MTYKVIRELIIFEHFTFVYIVIEIPLKIQIMFQLSELTMDLAEERSSAALANQRLKMESAEKMRLEKELGDIQV